MLAAIRSNGLDFALLIHVLGAIVLVGGLVTAAGAGLIGWRDEGNALRRFSYFTLLAVDHIHVLVGIAGHDEPAGRALDRERVSEPLHLDRVLHTGLLLRRQRERAPESGVLQRPFGVRVEGDLHLDHQVEAFDAPSGLLRASG